MRALSPRRLKTLGVIGVLAGALIAACAGTGALTPPQTSTASGEQVVRLDVRRTPLGPFGYQMAEGVRFRGALTLRGDLHGLSDMQMVGDEVWSVTDYGQLARFRIRLNGDGRLIGASDAIVRPLIGPDGAALSGKVEADAEGLAILDDGRVLVSFERDHRIWSYGPGASERPTPVAHPDAAFPDNNGMEGLAPSHDGGWMVMGEDGGAWTCRASVCAALPQARQTPDDGYRFTGADRDPNGDGWFVVERFFAPPVDMRMRVRRMAADGTLGPVLIQLRPPASVDNMEGIAAVKTDQGVRLYVLSDDNDNPPQRTLLMAFDVADAHARASRPAR